MAREAILIRQEAEFQAGGRIVQTATRHIVAAVHGAMGSKRGAKRAEKIEFFRERVRGVPQTETVVGRLGEPEISWEELVAKAAEVSGGS